MFHFSSEQRSTVICTVDDCRNLVSVFIWLLQQDGVNQHIFSNQSCNISCSYYIPHPPPPSKPLPKPAYLTYINVIFNFSFLSYHSMCLDISYASTPQAQDERTRNDNRLSLDLFLSHIEILSRGSLSLSTRYFQSHAVFSIWSATPKVTKDPFGIVKNNDCISHYFLTQMPEFNSELTMMLDYAADLIFIIVPLLKLPHTRYSQR